MSQTGLDPNVSLQKVVSFVDSEELAKQINNLSTNGQDMLSRLLIQEILNASTYFIPLIHLAETEGKELIVNFLPDQVQGG
ncbi:hypothetical protein HP548_02795 [Paenibacillus taichungensis]|uniref:Uncharacterized protein n=1 Tax=Paenibacillus taichungensis TaxID=484184 RepID=A0ABX2MH16_9BACL|nr:hypothetical protein [Paenibacillus taichungensis]NUU53024.1 hypothetical protein [Paenibacillus taichungensis]